jgi:hypothetical protein
MMVARAVAHQTRFDVARESAGGLLFRFGIHRKGDTHSRVSLTGFTSAWEQS